MQELKTHCILTEQSEIAKSYSEPEYSLDKDIMPQLTSKWSHYFNSDKNTLHFYQFNKYQYNTTIEIIDIECILLSFLTKNFVFTKWRIYKVVTLHGKMVHKNF